MLEDLDNVVNVDEPTDNVFAKIKNDRLRSNKNAQIYERMTNLIASGASVLEASIIVSQESGYSAKTIRNKWPELKAEYANSTSEIAAMLKRCDKLEREEQHTDETGNYETDRKMFAVIVRAMAEDFDTAVSLIGKEKISQIFSKIDL